VESETGQREEVTRLRAKQATEDKIEKAIQFAREKHKNQKRKYTGEEYFVHLQGVADIIRSIGGTPDMICAAYLHDCIEDQGVTPQEITDLLGPEVTKLVVEMTEVSKLEDGNRATRKALDRQHYGSISPKGQTIKLADIYNNGHDILQCNPGFARTYIPELEALFLVLTAGDQRLRSKVAEMIAYAKNKLSK
jgi:(p)ppGpp synthase/HD superfamily hydrolase